MSLINNQEFLRKFSNVLNVLDSVFNDYFLLLNNFNIEFNKNLSDSEIRFYGMG